MYSVKVETINPRGFRIYQCAGPVELQYGDACIRLILSDPDQRLDLPDGTRAFIMEAGVTIEQIRGQSRRPAVVLEAQQPEQDLDAASSIERDLRLTGATR